MFWPKDNIKNDRYCGRCGCKLWPWDVQCPNTGCRTKSKPVILTEFDRRFLAELRIEW